jgi:hypothetical protein
MSYQSQIESIHISQPAEQTIRSKYRGLSWDKKYQGCARHGFGVGSRCWLPYQRWLHLSKSIAQAACKILGSVCKTHCGSLITRTASPCIARNLLFHCLALAALLVLPKFADGGSASTLQESRGT